jgi:hypothetical protein
MVNSSVQHVNIADRVTTFQRDFVGLESDPAIMNEES